MREKGLRMETLFALDSAYAEVTSLIGAAHHDEDDFLAAQALESIAVEDEVLFGWWGSLLA